MVSKIEDQFKEVKEAESQGEEVVRQGLFQHIPNYLLHDILYELARMYYEDIGTEENIGKASELLYDLAVEGHALAQFSLSLMFLYGVGRNQSNNWAFFWMKRAQEQGLLEAQHQLGLMHYGGIGTERSFTKAFQLFEISAEQGYLPSLYNQAIMLLRGEERYDPNKSLQLFEIVAEQGYVLAKYNLALMLLKGEGTERNPKRAFHLFVELTEQGHVPSIYNQSIMLLRGEGVAHNENNAVNAFKLLREAWIDRNYYLAEQALDHGTRDTQYASYNFSLMYDRDQDLKISEFIFQSVYARVLEVLEIKNVMDRLMPGWMNNREHLWMEIMLAEYNDERDLIRAVEEQDLPEGQKLILALEYKDTNPELALRWLEEISGKISADQEQFVQSEERTLLLENQEQDEQRNRTPLEALQEAAKQGYASAQYELGLKYEDKDPERSVQLWKEAAKQEHIHADYSLGLMYLKGSGTRINIDMAFYRLRKAAQRGLFPAKKVLASLQENLAVVGDYGDKGRRYLLEKSSKWSQRVQEVNTRTEQYTKAHEQYESENFEEAFQLFKQLAVQGHAPSQYHLFLMISREQVKGDPELAFNWLTRSVRGDHLPALFDLVIMVCEGRGDRKNIDRAKQLLKKMAEQGKLRSHQCLDLLDSVNKKGGHKNNENTAGGVGASLLAAEGVRQTISGSVPTAEASSWDESHLREANFSPEGSNVVNAEVLTGDVPADQIEEAAREAGEELVTEVGSVAAEVAADIALPLVPVVGAIPGVYEAIWGKHTISGRELETWERWVSAGGAAFSFVGLGVLKNAKHVKYVGLVWEPVKNGGNWLVKLSGDQWSRIVGMMNGGQVERAREYVVSLLSSLGERGVKRKRAPVRRRRVVRGGGSSVDEVSKPPLVVREGFGPVRADGSLYDVTYEGSA